MVRLVLVSAMRRYLWPGDRPQLGTPLVALILLLASSGWLSAAPATPNVVVILADDLGYGDVACNNPERGKIATPNIDRIAREGMRFTDGHSSSAVCSPSRYALLTGRFHWRSRLRKGIVGVWEPPLIAPERLTIAGLLKSRGYRTACIGKWHLGWDWPIPKEERPLFRGAIDYQNRKLEDEPATEKHRAAWRNAFAQPIAGGPTTRGFDLYFGTDVPNWPPYAFIENNQTIGIPDSFLPARLFVDNQASLQGPALTGWTLEPILPTLVERAEKFIAQSADARQPFFLYLPLTAPHTPIAVNEAWRGKSGLNAYADFVMETDAAVGRVLAALDTAGVAAQTLVVFTSDNGCAPPIGVKELEQRGHYPSGPLRGYKSDVWEGGHRVPFLARWPGVVQPGSVSAQLVHQADLLATVAEVVGAPVPEGAGEDSLSFLPLLKGSAQPHRTVSVSQSAAGLLSVRKGSWKLIFGPGSGGWSKEKDDQPAQLYNLADDLGEANNLYAARPEVVAELTALMERLVTDGRSTPGAVRKNDVTVDWKQFLPAKSGP